MRAEHIVLREDVGVAETQIHMRMRSQVKDGVNVVFLQAPDHVGGCGDIAVEEAEVRLLFQHARIVQRAAVVELVERHDVVGVGIFDGQVAHKPRSTVVFLARSAGFGFVEPRFLSSDTVRLAYMKPSPPVTNMFFTFGSGVNAVWPVRTGASCHVPSSTKKRDSRLVGPDIVVARQHSTARAITSKYYLAVLTTGTPG